MVDSNAEPRTIQAIEQFYFAYRAFTARPDEILQEKGLNRAHHRILYFVGRNPGITVSQLLTTLNVSKQALNGPLRALVEQKLVSAAQADHDRRVRQLWLSPQGQKLEKKLTKTQAKLLARVFEKVGTKDTEGWIRVMSRLAKKGL